MKILFNPFTGTFDFAGTGGGGGSGITSVNGLTATAILIVTGSSGTDFNITTSGSDTVNLNIPTSSSINRGLLNSSDWSTFNSKLSSTTGFAQGGNSFGGTGILGTNDSQSLQIRTAGTQAILINTTQKATFANNVELSSLSILDSTYKSAIDVQSAGILRLGNGFNNLNIQPNLLTLINGNSQILVGATSSLSINAGPSSPGGIIIGRTGTMNANTTNFILNTISGNFSPTLSGAGSLIGLLINTTINQTSTAQQPVNFIDINPTTSNVQGTLFGIRLRGVSIYPAGGTAWNIFADGNAPNKLGGSLFLPISLRSLTTTVTTSDYTILGDATSGNITINLPPASTFSNGSTGGVLNIKKIDSSVNTVTIDANGVETIDGSLTQVLTLQYQSFTIQCTGVGWSIIGKV